MVQSYLIFSIFQQKCCELFNLLIPCTAIYRLRMKKIIILIATTLVTVSANAQKDVWSIEQCIDHAIKNNIQIKQALTTVDVNKLNKTQARFNYLPSLSGSASYGASFGRSLDPTTYQFVDNGAVNNVNGSISLNTQVFAGMSKLYSLRKSEINLLASIQDVEHLKNEIMVSISASYLQILYNKEQISNSQNQIDVLVEQIDNISKKVEAGSIPYGAQLELEAQLANEKYNLVSNENTMANSLLTLTQLLELKSTNNFDIEIPDVSSIIDAPIIANVDQVNEQAQILPRIQASELRMQASELDIKLAKARYYPTLNFGASYGSSYSDARQRPLLSPDGSIFYGAYPFVSQLADNASSAISLSMQIPIFNGLTTRRNVNIAKLNAQNSKYSLNLEKNKLYKEIQQAYTDATAALKRYQSAMASVKSNEESFHYAEKKFTAGVSTSVDYTTAKNNLLNAQSMMLQAKFEYVFRIKLLDFYKGIPITL